MRGKRKLALAAAMISALMVGCGSQQAAPLETKGLPQMPPSSATIGNLAQQQAKKGISAQSVMTTAFCDDFNTFDTTRWNTYSTPGYWSFYHTAGSYEAANTSVQNGYLVLKTQYESGDVSSTTTPAVYRSAVVQSIDKMGYGTYDIWVRLNNTSSDPAVNGSTANGTFADINNYTELDYTDANTSPDTLIESKYGYGTPNDQIYSIYKTNQPASSTPVTTAQNLSQGFHHHKWEWTPSSLKFYVDDALVYSVTDPNLIPSEAAQMFFNAWPVNKPDWNMLGSAQTRYTMVDKFCYTPPVADPVLPPFPAASTNPIYVPLPVATIGGGTSFDLSDIEADSYQWTFSDGTTASGPYVEHTFATPGTYTATATLSRTTGETATYTTKVAVLPEIQNVVDKRDSNDSLTATFDLGEAIPGLEYSVDLGDGSPIETRSQFTHTYSKIGTFDYTVTIKDNRAALTGQSLSSGLKAQDTTTPPTIYKQTSFKTFWRIAPEARMSFSTNYGANNPIARQGATISFDAGASQDNNIEPSPLTYEWDFGNGQTATGAAATTTFSQQKTYVVTLKVTNKWGLSTTKRQAIFVRSPALNWSLNAKYPTINTASLEGEPSLDDLLAESNRWNASAQNSDANALRAQASFNVENTFPYVLGVGHNVVSGVHRPTADDGSSRQSFCNSYKLYVNGAERPAMLQADADNFFCDYMVITAGSIGALPAQQINTVLVSTSVGMYSTGFNVFNTLSVPKVTVAIVPNDFIDGSVASPVIKQSYLTDETTGLKTNALNVMFRESDVKAGLVEFDVPVLAVTSGGLFEDRLTGLFNARLTSPYIASSSVVDGLMVNGRASIRVKLAALNFGPNGRELDLGQVQLYGGSSECRADTSAIVTASRNALAGCLTMTTTTNFPSSNAPTDIPPFPKELQKSYQLGNHTFYGESADTAKAFGLYAQTGHILAQGYVEYAAPYLLIPEKREELQKLTEQLVADGKLSPGDVGKITLMNVGMWASAIPQGPLKPPSYSAIANASRNGLGTTADALEDVVKLENTRGMKTSEVNTRLLSRLGDASKVIENCLQCTKDLDETLQKLKLRNELDDSKISQINTEFNKSSAMFGNEEAKTKFVSLKTTSIPIVCPLGAQGLIRQLSLEICPELLGKIEAFDGKTRGLLDYGGSVAEPIVSGIDKGSRIGYDAYHGVFDNYQPLLRTPELSSHAEIHAATFVNGLKRTENRNIDANLYLNNLPCDIGAKEIEYGIYAGKKPRGCDYFLSEILDIGNKITVIVHKEKIPASKIPLFESLVGSKDILIWTKEYTGRGSIGANP